MNNLRKSKKAQVEYLLKNAFRIGFTVIALLAFFLLINLYVHNKIDTRYIQAETLAHRIIQSDAIMLQDSYTFRIYSGIIDLDKFKDNTSLDKSIPYTFNRHSAAKVKLYEKNVYGNKNFKGELYLNKNNWINLETLIRSGASGKGSASMLIKDYPVTCYDRTSNLYTYCIMTVEVIVPNS